MPNFQDLPDELVLKVLSYTKTKDIVSCGQLSKRIRQISHDGTLWANLEKKIVQTELLEMILSKGCKILNLSNSNIVGRFSSNVKSQLRVLNLSWFASTTVGWPTRASCTENFEVLEELLFLCYSLQHLKMQGIFITPKMAVSICKNDKTLQILDLNYSVFGTNIQVIIKRCQELKEVYLAYNNEDKGHTDDDLEFLAKNISPNLEKLNLSTSDVSDDQVKILLCRCNKIKVLILEETDITSNSLKTIRQYLNLTLEELSLDFGINYMNGYNIFTSFLELKSMARLKTLNLYNKKEKDSEIQNLKQHLPHLRIRTLSERNCEIFAKKKKLDLEQGRNSPASGAHRRFTRNPQTFRCLQCPFNTKDSSAMIGHHLHAHSSYPMLM